ncbi:MAG: hypothetical protein QM783_16070 [Phycisphaerales bacterium]
MFQRYLNRHSRVGKWIIAADFALHDKTRPMDCFAFTILPYDAWPAVIREDVAKALPRDLKESKALTERGIEWLRDPRQGFHVVITVEQKRPLFTNSAGTDPRAIAREHVRQTIATAKTLGLGSDTITRLKKLHAKTQARQFNVKLLEDVYLLSGWFAALTVILGRARSCECLGWFPDRDSMTVWCDGIWQDFVFLNVHVLAPALAVDMRNTKLVIGAPDRSGDQEIMWYDYMIRASDWFAGAVAAWDRPSNRVPDKHQKYKQMVEDVLADSENTVILHFEFAKGYAQGRRIVVESRPGQSTN